MKIGLVRHFAVTYKPLSKWMTSDQFNEWVDEYNKSEIHVQSQCGSDLIWDACLTSDLSRAVKTAEHLFKSEHIQTNQLREIEIHAVSSSIPKIKLHRDMWLFLGRAAWCFSHHSQKETKSQTLLRAQQVIEYVEQNYADSNVLVVTHGAYMKLLARELYRRGFKGDKFTSPQNGKTYMFDR